MRACRLLAGGTLWDLLKYHTRMTEPKVRVVARRLLEALAAMADVGVTHRDVKPMNMGLARPWDLKTTTLFDMGSWKRIGETSHRLCPLWCSRLPRSCAVSEGMCSY